MALTSLHSSLLSRAFEAVLGPTPDFGDMAFVRCLAPNVVEALAKDTTDFRPNNWQVFRVSDTDDPESRTITADRAVELRETKGTAVVLLVDTDLAGAGMDGIYSAAREINEARLFDQAADLAKEVINQQAPRGTWKQADKALKRARGHGNLFSISRWTEFDFLVRLTFEDQTPGELLYLLGLWPVYQSDQTNFDESLLISRGLVERLLGIAAAGITPSQRVRSLRLLDPHDAQVIDLERFLQAASTKPLLQALEDIADKQHLWVNKLPMESSTEKIHSLELLPWRTSTGRIAKWSGLTDIPGDGNPPQLLLSADDLNTGNYTTLEVRWRSRPDNLAKGAVDYQVAILTDMDEEVAVREINHTARSYEKCRFTNDDFSLLNEDALISAKLVISVIGNNTVDPQESEEFTIRFGEPQEHEPAGVGKKVRTFSEGLLELSDRETVSEMLTGTENLPEDAKNYVLLRSSQLGKSFRVFRPPLLRDVEQDWANRQGDIGRWRIKVRASGERASEAEFVPLADFGPGPKSDQLAIWERTVTASRRMADLFAAKSGVGQVYDDNSKEFKNIVKDYLLAWAALLEAADPALALANTVEVQTLSRKVIGLIVLPSHPLRVAWHVAYDNLVLHTAFEQAEKPKNIRSEFSVLDGAMFPPFLPGVEGSRPFVFADMLGFHTAGMVLDTDKEPKAAVAILARALGENESADTAPTLGKHSAQVLGKEVLKYMECHRDAKLLHVNALRPGDGMTVARALGQVQSHYAAKLDTDHEESLVQRTPAFVLELYPSTEQRGLAGRFIAEAREKRRSGAGVISAEDRWMLESLSLPGGLNLPKLRWARKRNENPRSAAHIAMAFDTFDSRIGTDAATSFARPTRPLYVYGLLSFFDREYSMSPSPLWRSIVPAPADGEKHPADRTHTDRLIRLQQAVERCVVKSIAIGGVIPVLRTELSPEKEDSLYQLHQRCDWVITVDRNGGVEYFDSPRTNGDVYDIFVIDTVPERDDLGSLQLITSTSHLAEIRGLLNGVLDQMGLSHSRQNAQFLMDHLKALSGRLAIRLTGQKAPASELIALALCHANCARTQPEDPNWSSLDTGFLVPVDDVQDLLPPLFALGADTSSFVTNARPDLIYVSVVPRKGLSFQFIEVKYRRHLRTSRSPQLLEGIRHQLQSLRTRWDDWYSDINSSAAFMAIRRAKLARVLRFYADKAHRHSLSDERYETIVAEIDRMIEKGTSYSFAPAEMPDSGWVFCPEYTEASPLKTSPDDWDTRIIVFGPNLLPDLALGSDASIGEKPVITEPPENAPPPANSLYSAQTDIRKEESPGSVRIISVVDNVESGSSNTSTSDDEQAITLGSDLFTGSDIRWRLMIKGNPHLLIAGLPGMGKTTCLVNMCRQMLDVNVQPIVFSYHEDIDERLMALPKSARFLDFRGLGFNPLQVIDRKSPKAYLDMAGAMRDIFVAIYPELGDIQGERIRKAIKESFTEQGWDDPAADRASLVEPSFGRFVAILRAEPKPDHGLRTLLFRLDELEDYGMFDYVESPTSLWEGNQPVIVRIHQSQNENLQKAFASLILYGLYKDMFRRGVQERITHAVIFDEAHRAGKLHLLPTMAKECRKYGISLVVASQEARDFSVSLYSAIANYLVLRINETDAKALVRNVASSDQERTLIDKIKQMEKYKALYFSEGRKKPSLVALLP